MLKNLKQHEEFLCTKATDLVRIMNSQNKKRHIPRRNSAEEAFGTAVSVCSWEEQ